MDTSLSPPQSAVNKAQNVSNVKQQKAKKLPLPPPIVVDGIENFNEIHEKLDRMMSGFRVKIMNDECIKINVPDEECYRNLTRMLNNEKRAWHSYENKQNRPIKVMAKSLHHSCNPEKIVNELRKRGFKAIDAVNKLQWKTKQPLNMFMLVFSQDEDINKIFGITDILGIRVEIHPIRKSNLVPQCKRCQAYGHTQRYCGKPPRCVKCPGKHLTRDCPKSEEELPKCVHCGENHPANYRGCVVAKEMQKLKNKLVKKISLPKQPLREKQQPQGKRNNTPGSYSQAVTGAAHINENGQSNNKQNDSTEQVLQLILDKLNKQEQVFKHFEERLTKLEYSAKGAIPKHKNG